jgi:hypothetical protein
VQPIPGQPIQDQAAATKKFVEAVSGNAYPFLKAVVAVGVVSMIVLQSLKDLLPLRNWFHRYFIHRWMKQKASEARHSAEAWMSMSDAGNRWFKLERERIHPPPDNRYFLDSPRVKKAEEDLLQLAGDGYAKAFYGQPVERLCKQITSAAQVLLDRPIRHPDLFLCLASKANAEDAARVMFPPKDRKAEHANQGDEQARNDSYVEARARVAHQIQRAIGALQITVESRWQLAMRLSAIVLSGLFAWLGMRMFWKGSQWLLSALVAVAGGCLASMARDLVVTLQQLRKN